MINPKAITISGVIDPMGNNLISSTSYIEELNLFVTGTDGGAIHFWNSKNMELVSSEIIHRSGINCITHIPKRNLIATASTDKTIKLFNMKP